MDGLSEISGFELPIGSDGLSDGRFSRLGQDGPALHRQRSLRSPIGCTGIGLHSGRRIAMTLRPAAADTGIVFRRTDLAVASGIPARFDHVVDSRLCTVIALPDRPDVRVGTIEHVMAALAGLGIDNAVVEVDGPEVPIFDGSASSLAFLLDCAGTVAQEAPRAAIEILRPVRVEDGDSYAELRPGAGDGLEMGFSIVFATPAIGSQALSLALSPGSFRTELADARTFALAADVAGLHAAGLALGGSLENAVVVEHDRVVNPGGLRRPDEFVRHKLLDAVGDLALAGAPIVGSFVGHRSGHHLTNRLLRTLFARTDAWRRTVPSALPHWFPAAA